MSLYGIITSNVHSATRTNNSLITPHVNFASFYHWVQWRFRRRVCPWSRLVRWFTPMLVTMRTQIRI